MGLKPALADAWRLCLGPIPLVVYIFVHLWRTSPRDRESFVRSMRGVEPLELACDALLFLIPVLAFAGVQRLWSSVLPKKDAPSDDSGAGSSSTLEGRSGDADDPGRASRRPPTEKALHWGAGILGFSWVLFHLWDTWLQKVLRKPVLAIYHEFSLNLGRPITLVFYVVGIACLHLHLGEEILRFASRFVFERSKERSRPRWIEYGVWLLVAFMFAWSVNNLSALATGEAIFWSGVHLGY
ncbi:MAG: hypothetical protein AAF355_05385 [Myxococcota bacterium]